MDWVEFVFLIGLIVLVVCTFSIELELKKVAKQNQKIIELMEKKM